MTQNNSYLPVEQSIFEEQEMYKNDDSIIILYQP